MKLYSMPKAPNPRRVQLFLAEKGLSIDSVDLDVVAGENLRPEFLALNPRGVTPVLLLDDGSALTESIAICRYFEALHPEPNLFGSTPMEIARIEEWQRICELDGMYATALAFRNAAPHFANRSAPGATPPTAQIADLIPRGEMLTRRFFDLLDSRLQQSAFVGCDRFSVADITAYVACDFARWIKVQPEAHHEALNAWRATVKARPSITPPQG